MKQVQETNSTHTQGEWESEQILGATDIVSGSIRIALINHNSTPTLEEAKANAKLIAAAPDLLEALIKISISLEQLPCKQSDYNMVLNAINKATN